MLLVLILFNFFGLQPEKVKFELKLGQSKPIYNAFKAIKESTDWEALSAARKRIVECKYPTILFKVELNPWRLRDLGFLYAI